jgi:hypothetical protein
MIEFTLTLGAAQAAEPPGTKGALTEQTGCKRAANNGEQRRAKTARSRPVQLKPWPGVNN